MSRSICKNFLSELGQLVLDSFLSLYFVNNLYSSDELFFLVKLQVDEWWEQPAATAVDWVTVDGQNVAAWLNHVKQLQMAFYDKELL